MAQKKTRLGQAADLRRLAEEIARKNATQSPDNLEAMSPETIRQTLHELRVYQIELEMQNEELRQAHAVLDALHTRYFDLYDLAPVGYCTVSEKGLILEANLTAATMLGVTRNGLVKQPISLFILNKDQDIYYRHRKLLFATGKPQMCEVRMLRRDATPFCVRLDATVPQGGKGESMSRVVISDITERQQAEEKLRDSEKQYRTLFEAIADAVFLIDQETGHLLDVNPAATRMYGFNREEFLQMTAMDVSAEFEKTASAVSKPVPFIPLRNHRHKDGSVFPVELTASIFELEGRKTIITTARDITERKQVEKALEEQRRRLQQALDEVRTLRGIVPICAYCKKIRDDEGYWNQVEKYLSYHTDAKFSHGICPTCFEREMKRIETSS